MRKTKPAATALRILLRLLPALVPAAVLLAAPETAHAQAAATGEFGRSHLIISADRAMGLFSYASTTTTIERPNGITTEETTSGPGISLLVGGNPTNVHNLPRFSIDYALAMGLTIGGSVPFSVGLGGTRETTVTGRAPSSVDTPTVTLIGLVPRVGYVLHLSDTFSFWPRGGFAYYSSTEKSTGINGQGVTEVTTVSNSYFSIDIDPQFVITPLPHLGVTVGPMINIPIAGSREIETKTGSVVQPALDADHTVFNFGLNVGLLTYF